jgi:hypothetical protein
LATERLIAALAKTAGVTTGERAAMQDRSRPRATAGREIGVIEIGGTRLILTALGGKRTFVCGSN